MHANIMHCCKISLKKKLMQVQSYYIPCTQHTVLSVVVTIMINKKISIP